MEHNHHEMGSTSTRGFCPATYYKLEAILILPPLFGKNNAGDSHMIIGEIEITVFFKRKSWVVKIFMVPFLENNCLKTIKKDITLKQQLSRVCKLIDI